MTRIEYDLIRDQEPQLWLPHFHLLSANWQEKALSMTREQLIAGRAAKLLASEHPQKVIAAYLWTMPQPA